MSQRIIRCRKCGMEQLETDTGVSGTNGLIDCPWFKQQHEAGVPVETLVFPLKCPDWLKAKAEPQG